MGTRRGIIIEGFLLQARNIHLFIPVFLIVLAYTTITTLGYSTVVQPPLNKVIYHARDLWRSNRLWRDYNNLMVATRGHLVAASTAYLLVTAFTTGPAVLAVTVCTAVTACSGERSSSSFHGLVRKLLAGGDRLKGPFGTALLGHVLHGVACRGALFVFWLYVGYFRRYTSPVLQDIGFLLFLGGHPFDLYIEVVCILAVVVSAAEPAGCFYGVRAMRQAWWIMANKATPAVVLVFVKGAVKAVTVTVFTIVTHYYFSVAYTILSGFVYISLCATLQLWFVCATTTYYYQCRQRKNSYRCSI